MNKKQLCCDKLPTSLPSYCIVFLEKLLSKSFLLAFSDLLCDATYHCWDTTDETEETCNAHECKVGQYRCPNRVIGKLCLNKNQLCDGRKDCSGGGADESPELCRNEL